MSKPWLTVVIILVLTFVVNVGYTWLTLAYPAQFLPPLQ
jgi:hypothetical protein